MLSYRNFFTNLGFDFEKNLKSIKLIFEKNPELTTKLENFSFYYSSPNNTNTSFYLITLPLSELELIDIKRYLWNKNDADLFFYIISDNENIIMSYAKYSPLVSLEESILDSFNTSNVDLEKIEKIRHWQFDSGAFWLNYYSFIDKAKYKGIDKELASTLKVLKDQLCSILCFQIEDGEKRDEIVQALIDRTLYIKYLEDNHIINSSFYKYYFNNESLDYKQLLHEGNKQKINKLFKEIHKIFNNNLFDRPTIENEYLTEEICNLIAQSFNANLSTGQLRLFDFQFNILPVEFISYIYEVFLSEKQKENGIYYTPKKLAQLIVDDVITNDKIGSVLDPSCGSGMFLIVAFQRLLEIARNKGTEPTDNLAKIKFRTELLSKNIFGIEKEKTAQRFTLFSLSLQIFRDIDPIIIKDYIDKNLEKNNKIDLFSEYSFFENIKCANTLCIEENTRPFKDNIFEYIVGNPPFFEIPDTLEYSTEISFLNEYKIKLNTEILKKAGDIVGRNQISQCFFLKLKDWSDSNTRFGFISNSSSFYNDYSITFQSFFYRSYSIEKIYELSRVKDILFEKAEESVISIIFNNKKLTENIIEYYPVDLGLFSEKPFELLIIQQDTATYINQNDLINQTIRLRDYLVGNEYDIKLLKKIGNNDFLKDYTFSIKRGFEIWGEDARKKEFNLPKTEWAKINKKEKGEYLERFINKYFSNNKNNLHNKSYIKPSHLKPFTKLQSTQFISSIENFHRPRIDRSIYKGKKLIFSRLGKMLNCVYSDNEDYFDFSVYTFKLREDKEHLYYLFQALLNSQIIEYYITYYQRKRVFDSFSRIGNEDILNIPIPRELDEDITNQVSDISRKITEGEYSYDNKKEELNELIFDLYELSYFEKQRIRDYFLSESKKKKINRNFRRLLNDYKSVLTSIISPYLTYTLSIDLSPAEFDLIVAKISLNGSSNTPSSSKVMKYILNEIFEQNPNENILTGQEKIFGKDCVYIIKKNIVQYWTKTKAFEDGQDVLKHLISYLDEERIHQN